MNIKDILKRLREHYKISNNSNLAKIINVKESTISTWISRNTIPFKTLIEVSLNEKMSLNWLVFGEGEKFKENNSLQKETIININLNIKNYNDEKEIKNVIQLLEYAPKQYLERIKNELESIKNITENKSNGTKR